MYNRYETQAAPMREYDAPDQAVMEPYTIQITNRLNEADKFLSEILNRAGRIADKLVGPVPETLGNSDKNLKSPPPIAVAMMEQIVGQSNILNRKLSYLSEILNRLEAL